MYTKYRFKLIFGAIWAALLCQHASAQTLADNVLMHPKDAYVVEATDADSYLCGGNQQCTTYVAVGKFRNGGSDNSSINIFVASIDLSLTPTIVGSWTVPELRYLNTPFISVGDSGKFVVAINNIDNTDQHYLFFNEGATIKQALITTRGDISGAEFFYNEAEKNNEGHFFMVGKSAKKLYVLAADIEDDIQRVWYEDRTGEAALPSYCLTCSVGSGRQGRRLGIVGGYYDNAPHIYSFKNDQNNSRFSRKISCASSSTLLENYVILAVDGLREGNDDSDPADYNLAAVGVDQTQTQKIFFYRYFSDEDNNVLYIFDLQSPFQSAKVQVARTKSSSTSAFYFVKTDASTRIFRLENQGSGNMLKENTIAFADNMQSTFIRGYAAFDYTNGAYLWGNFFSFTDKHGTVSATSTSGMFFAGIQGINSNHEYSTYDSSPPTSHSMVTSAECGSCLITDTGNINKDTITETLNKATASNVDFRQDQEWTLSSCDSNMLAYTTTQSSIAYQIEPTSVPTAQSVAPTVSETVSSCTNTKALEIYDTATAAWVAVSTGSPAWFQSVDADLRFVIDTNDGSLHGFTYNLRFVFSDTVSTTAQGTVYQEFTVTFDYICVTDTMTLDAANDQGIVIYEIGFPSQTLASSYVQLQTGCPKTATLQYYSETAFSWVDISSGPLNGVVTVSTANDATFGSVTVVTSDQSFSPQTTYQMRTYYTSTDSLATDKEFYDEWQLKIRSECYTNQLTLSGSTTDQTVDILDGSVDIVQIASGSTASKTVSTCTLQETFQLQSSLDQTWSDLTTATPWVLNINYGATNTIDVGTSDWATYNGQTFTLRIKYIDTNSGEATNTIYDTFRITFVFICESDTLTLDPIADYSFILGDPMLTIPITTSQSQADCAGQTTLVYEAYSESIQDWVAASTQTWYSSETNAMLTFAISSSGYAEFQPSKVVTVRVTYSSTYSTTASATVEQTFTITVTDTCNGNIITPVQSPLDLQLMYNIGANTADTATSRFSYKNSNANCPMDLDLQVQLPTGSWADYSTVDWITNEQQGAADPSYDEMVILTYGHPGDISSWASNRPTISFLFKYMLIDQIGHSTPLITTWTVTWTDECSDFAIASNQDPIENFVFVMGQTAAMDMTLDLNTNNCDTVYILQYKTVAVASYSTYTAGAVEVLSNWDDSVGSFRIFADQSSTVYNTYSPEQLFYISVTAQNTLSTAGNSYTEDFIVTFQDVCATNTLTDSVTQELYTHIVTSTVTTVAIDTVPATTHSTSLCPLTYEFEWLDTDGTGTWQPLTQADIDSKQDLVGTIASGQMSTSMDQAYFESIRSAPYPDFEIRYRWKVSDPRSTDAQNSYQSEFTVTYKHGCQSDEIELNSNLSNIELALFDSHTFTVDFTQTSGGGCALTYLFEIVNSNTNSDEVYSNTAPHSHYVTSYSDATAVISAADPSTNQQYDTQTITFKITITIDASQSSKNYVWDEWQVTFVSPCRMQSSKTFSMTSPAGTTQDSPTIDIIVNSSSIVTWTMLFDAWDQLANVQQSGCALSVKLLRDDTSAEIATYTPTVSFGDTNGSVDITNWVDGEFTGIIQVRAEITITATNEKVYEYERPVYVQILNLCLQSPIYSSQTLSNFEYNLGNADQQNSFVAYVDSPQQTTGQLLCGATSYSIVDAQYQVVSSAKLSVSGITITLHQTNDFNDVTNADVTYYLKVYKPDYEAISPQTVIHYEPFTVNIKSCLVDQITSESDQTITYNRGSGTMTVTYSAFGQVPNAASLPVGSSDCGYTLEYTTQWRTYYNTVISLPYFVTWDEQNLQFTIFTDDVNDLTSNYQTYVIELIGSTKTSDQNPPATKTQTFTFTVEDGCLLDEVSQANPAWDSTMIYYLGGETQAPGLPELGGAYSTIQLDAAWSNSVADCPFEVSMEIQDNVSTDWREMTSSEKLIVNWTPNVQFTGVAGATYNAPHLQATVTNTDMSMDQASWYIRALWKSTLSTSSSATGIYETTIEWRHVCWDLIKIPAIPDSIMTATMFDVGTVAGQFSAATSSWSDANLCGPYTYSFQLVDAKSGYDLPADFSTFESFLQISGTQIVSNFNDMEYSNEADNTGQYEVMLKTQYGIYGDDSRTFTLVLENPCNTPTWQVPGDAYTSSGPVDTNDPLLATIEVMGEATTFTFIYPQLLESSIYGSDSYSLCGERTVYLEEKSQALYKVTATGKPAFQAPYVTLSAELKPNDFSQRSFTVTFQSTSVDDYGVHEFVFKQGLEKYPNAAEWTFDIGVRIDPCVVTDFSAPADLQVEYTIGDPLKTIRYVFDQYPCGYSSTYSVAVVDPANQSLPDYIQFSTSSGVLTVFSKDREDVGTVQVSITATLANLELLQTGQFSYSVDPRNIPSDFIYQASFNIEITMMAPGQNYASPRNTAPYLVPKPGELTAYIGESFTHSFGQAYDLEGDNVTITMALGAASIFANFDSLTNTLSIAEGATSLDDTRIHILQMTLVDDNVEGPMATTYKFTLELKEVPQPGEAELSNNLMVFHGLVTSPAEIYQNITAMQDYFEKRIFDVRETNLEEIYSNKHNKTEFSTVDLFEGTPFDIADFKNSTDEEEVEQDEGNVKMKKQLPEPRIESLSSDGKLTIRFSRKMKVPKRYRDIEESQVALRWLEAEGNVLGKTETYLIGEGFRDFEIRPALDLKVIPSKDDAEPQDIAFTWEIVSFHENEVVIQLYFDNPEMLSADPLSTDNLLVTFWANDFFVSENGSQVRQGQTIKVKVIRQIDSQTAETQEKNAKIFGFSVLSCLFVAFIFAICQGADTLPIWALYDTLILIGHLPLMNVNMPGSTVIFLTTLTKTLSFSFIDVNTPMIEVLNKDAMNVNLGVLFFQAGYESVYIIVNLARTIVAIGLLVILGLLAHRMDKNDSCRFKRPRTNGRTEVQYLGWNNVTYNVAFRTLLCIYLTVCVSVFINFKADQMGESGIYQRCSLFITIFFLIVMIGYILALLFIGVKESLKDKPARAVSPNYQTVFLGLKWNGKPNSFLYLIYFMARRFIFAMAAVLLQGKPMQQIFALILSSVLMMMLLLRLRPFAMPHNQKLQLLNETFFFTSCMVLLSFTPAFNVEPRLKERVGYLIPFIVLVAIFFNLLMQVHAIWWQFAFNRRQRLNQKKSQLAKNFTIRIDQGIKQEQAPQDDNQDEEPPIKAAYVENMAQIREETEEDSSNGAVSYLPRRHEQKRNMYKSKVQPNEMNVSSVSVTNMNDITADNMMVGDNSIMGDDESSLRPPGPPIGYGNLGSFDDKDSALFRSPDVTGRSAANLISSSRQANDNERVLDREVNLDVFNKGFEVKKVEGLFNQGIEKQSNGDDHSSLSQYRRRANSPPRIRSSEQKHTSPRIQDDPLSDLIDSEIQRQIDSNRQPSEPFESESGVTSSKEDDDIVHVMSKVQRKNKNRNRGAGFNVGAPQFTSQEAGSQDDNDFDDKEFQL